MRCASRAQWIGALLTCALTTALLAGCAGDLDPTVVLHHEMVASQPWVASGDLVDAGKFCPSGDRENVGLAHPDGTPMTVVELMALFEAAWRAGGGPMDVPRIGWTEHVCDDGSGSFVLREEVVAGDASFMPAEVTDGTGAYADLRGHCTIELVTDETSGLEDMTTICQFEIGE